MDLTNHFLGRALAVEAELAKLPQVEIPVSHVFCGGMYARTIAIKKGTLLTGAIHLHEQLNIVHGDISIGTEAGEQRYTGSHVIASMPGTKRFGYAHEDTTWTTILKTDETDVEKIEAELVTNRIDDPRLPHNQILELEQGE